MEKPSQAITNEGGQVIRPNLKHIREIAIQFNVAPCCSAASVSVERNCSKDVLEGSSMIASEPDDSVDVGGEDENLPLTDEVLLESTSLGSMITPFWFWPRVM